MGKIEQAVRKRTRKQNIQRAVLTTIAVAGVLAVAMAAPNTLRLLKYTPLGRKKGQYRVRDTIGRLIERGEIIRTTERGRPMFSLTRKGHIRLARLTLDELGTSKRRWDGQWRIVVFDIREEHRRARDLLRGTLIAMGFFKLQNSVWVYPHDCEDLITLLKTNFSVGRDVLYIVSAHVEGDWKLKKHFHLS